MTGSPPAMPPPARVAACALLLAFSLLSCSREAVRSFPFSDADGKRIGFSLVSAGKTAPKSGSEGVWTAGDANASQVRRFVPAKPVNVPGARSVRVTLKMERGGRSVNVAVVLRAAGKKSVTQASFLAERGEFAAIMELSGACTVEEVRVGVGTGAAERVSSPPGAGDAQQVASIMAIAVEPAFSGFRRSGSRLEISSGYQAGGMIRNGSWTEAGISAPAAEPTRKDGRTPVILLEYSGSAAADIELSGDKGGRLLLRAQSPTRRAILTPDLFAPGTTGITARFPPGTVPLTLCSTTLPRAEAELADLGRVALAAPPGVEDGGFRLYRWDILPDVFVFDFRDYATQDEYLKRLAFFVEKEGYRGRLANDSEISGLHGWNAHDYRAADLAAFFDLAKRKSFALNRSERELESVLLERGVILRSGQGYAAGKGAIISVTGESPGYLRRTFLTHESTHAIFFADHEYADFVSALWKGMESGEKWFWILYFDWMHYDVGSAYLMANEVQAYLLQQPIAGAKEYFTATLPPRVLETNPEFRDRIVAYMDTYGDRFEARARQLDAWLRARYGFGAGRTFFLR